MNSSEKYTDLNVVNRARLVLTLPVTAMPTGFERGNKTELIENR